MKKTVYFISYSYPPNDGINAGYFVKYLAKNGWDVKIITKSFGKNEIIKTKYGTLYKIRAMKNQNIKKILYKLHLFPCPHILWSLNVIKNIKKIMKKEGVVYALYPPLSNFLIAYKIKKTLDYPLVIDYRDEFYDINIKDKKVPGKKLYKNFEKKLLKSANLLTVSTDYLKTTLLKRYKMNSKDIHVIYNGFDPDTVKHTPKLKSDKFIILYGGALTAIYKPEVLNIAYKKLIKKYPDLKNKIEIRIFGSRNRYFNDKIKPTIIPGIIYGGHVKHSKMLEEIAKANVCFFSLDPKYAYAHPKKIFEYVSHKKPIVAMLPKDATYTLLKKFGIGKVVEFGKYDELVETIYKLYTNKKIINKLEKNIIKHKSRFETGKQIKKLSNLMTRLIK